jgi:hypothetical protein
MRATAASGMGGSKTLRDVASLRRGQRRVDARAWFGLAHAASLMSHHPSAQPSSFPCVRDTTRILHLSHQGPPWRVGALAVPLGSHQICLHLGDSKQGLGHSRLPFLTEAHG